MLALCSIGKSTKQASDPRYIGNKGIGWKSVFKITPRPQVHSRDYHLEFDALDPSGLGYIVPTPVAPPAGWLGKGTAIVLPLEEGRASDALRDFRIALDEIKPTLLLFLHQLRKLEVHDTELRISRRMERIANPDDEHVVLLQELEERDGQDPSRRQQEWLVVSRRLGTKVARLGIKTTEIALAFPLIESSVAETGSSLASALPMLDVFAFLPLRSYGMRFLLQADWVVPSSRESVDASSAWYALARPATSFVCEWARAVHGVTDRSRVPRAWVWPLSGCATSQEPVAALVLPRAIPRGCKSVAWACRQRDGASPRRQPALAARADRRE